MANNCRKASEQNYERALKLINHEPKKLQSNSIVLICASKLFSIHSQFSQRHVFSRRYAKMYIPALYLRRTPNMRLKTLLITLNWFANETVYLGLSYYGPSLGNNQHLSFFLSSLVEIPSYLCCWFIMDKWGRRWPMCLLMISR